MTLQHDLLWMLRRLHYRRATVTLSVLYGVLGLGSAIALTGCSAWLIARAAQQPSISVLGLVVVGVRSLGISRGVFRYLERVRSHDLALGALARLRADLFAQLSQLPLARLTRLGKGDWLNQIGRDVDTLGETVVKGIFPFAVAAVTALASAVALATIAPLAACWFIIGVTIAGVASPLVALHAAHRSLVTSQARRARIFAVTHDLADHRAEHEVGAQISPELAALARDHTELNRALHRAARWRGAASGVYLLGVAVGVLGAAVTAIGATTAPGTNPVWYAVAVLLCLAAFEATAGLADAAQELVVGGVAAGRLRPIFDTSATTPTDAPPDTPPATDRHSPLEPISALSWNDLTVGWETEQRIHIGSATVAAGEVLVVAGPSGIGKTACLYTLAGLLAPRSGTVSWHTTSNAYSPHTVAEQLIRPHLAFVTEDAHIFAATLKENLQLIAGPVADANLRETLDTVGLHDWMTHLPDGLNTVLGENGHGLSGGTRRRLLLARAMVTSSDVVLLDEPTEHLDPATAQHVWATTVDWAQRTQRILIVASHDPLCHTTADHTITLKTATLER